MYVSITGLKTKNIFSWFKFWVLAIPAFRAAQRAKGIIFCETKKTKNYHHTLTVWESKNDMLHYKKSGSHMKAMQSFKNIATGKICSYETNLLPTWDQALERFNNDAHEV